MKIIKKFLNPPLREYAIALTALLALAIGFFIPKYEPVLIVVSLIGALPVLWQALLALRKLSVTIDVFNAVAVIIAFLADEILSATFIVLMLAFARLLDWRTETKTKNAIEELLKLKPITTTVEKDGRLLDVNTEAVRVGDTVVVKTGARVPVDGIVISGTTLINESSVTGESMLIAKTIGDSVIGLTLNESEVIKIRAMRVGKDSTSERMVELMREATKRKSNPEKIADKFAKIFLPVVGLLGLGTYLLTGNIKMTAALFLVACADDMAVAIPLAMTAAFGAAAKRGIIVKGGTALDTLSKIKTLIFDKTGTLTYGKITVRNIILAPKLDENLFWKMAAIGEKFSEHPLAKAIFHEAVKKIKDVPDPDEFRVHKGSGVWAKFGKDEIAIGDESLFEEIGITLHDALKRDIEKKRTAERSTVLTVFINQQYAGLISVSDTPREEAKESIEQLRALGIQKIIMFTGDSVETAKDVAEKLSIKDIRSGMLPKDKLDELEKLEREGLLGMVGDGINDAPALSRADVSIAMGSGGTAVTVETADIVVLHDNLSKLPEAIILARKTMSVIRVDMIIWLISNLFGFALVFTGIAGPALASFYNFITDFFPLINSARLFKLASGAPAKNLRQ